MLRHLNKGLRHHTQKRVLAQQGIDRHKTKHKTNHTSTRVVTTKWEENPFTHTTKGVTIRWEDNPFNQKSKQTKFYLALLMYVVQKCSI